MSTAYYMLTKEKVDAITNHTKQIRELRQKLDQLRSDTHWYNDSLGERFKEESERLLSIIEREVDIDKDVVFIALSGNKIQWADRKPEAFNKQTFIEYIEDQEDLIFVDEYGKEITLERIKQILGLSE